MVGTLPCEPEKINAQRRLATVPTFWQQRPMPASTLPPTVTLVCHPLLLVKLTTLRDRRTEPEAFRVRLAEVSSLMIFEATRDLSTRPLSIETPLAPFDGAALERPIIIVPILRAGLGMAAAMLPMLSGASVGHVGIRRDEITQLPDCYCFSVPSHLCEADVIVVDPMLATGRSAGLAIAKLKEGGATRIRFVCLVSSPEGLAHLASAHPDVGILTAAVDRGLDARAYIIPGLGDAGDRYFGTVPAGRRAAE